MYDQDGRQLCCTLEEKVYSRAGANALIQGKSLAEKHEGVRKVSDEKSHEHDTRAQGLTIFILPFISLILLLLGIGFDEGLIPNPGFFTGSTRLIWYALSYFPVGFPVLKEAFWSVLKGEVFTEFLLMSLATIGAFVIGEYPEGVAVMLFYSIGEILQTMAVRRAQGNIKALIDQRPDEVTVFEDNKLLNKKASDVAIGSIVLLKPGDQVALDGVLWSESAGFNTAALTGESAPRNLQKGEPVLAGMINLNRVSQVKVNAKYQDSKLSKILDLVQHATAQKAPTELFIRKFAKIYTPAVVLLACLIVLLPLFFTESYRFEEWMYRALVFLVISCPCALVISIPLGYFGGIGAASRHGILFKGSNFLDIMASVQNIVMDKTGTMTKGVFKVQSEQIMPGFDREQVMHAVNALEAQSTHPIASAIADHAGPVLPDQEVTKVLEIPGHGLSGEVNGNPVLVGNFKLLKKYSVPYEMDPSLIDDTTIAIAMNEKFAGYLTIADEQKEDAQTAVDQLKALGVKLTMLSGDKTSVVSKVASRLGIQNAFGDLLPEDKVNKIKEIKARQESVAFVGDGVNDAPVVALSDVGIAMGGLGSDATVETADVVIQDDRPSKIPAAIRIGKLTKRIVWQNVSLAFSVKILVLGIGAGGLATMWEAVFADVGVALIAILNAVRIQRLQF